MTENLDNKPNLVYIRNDIGSDSMKYYLDVSKPFVISDTDKSILFSGRQIEINGTIYMNEILMSSKQLHVPYSNGGDEFKERVRIAEESRKFDNKVEELLNS